MGAEGLISLPALFRRLGDGRVTFRTGGRPLTPSHTLLVISFILAFACSLGTARAKSYGETAPQENWQITCYTCMNVSNNEECNRYAIDRPCPEGRDYCLTLHVMEGRDPDRSLLVNKRCASLEDCVGDSTGCTTSYGQTQCISCCDQPYCNDYVPSNDTNAVFQRSAARGTIAIPTDVGTIWRSAAMLTASLLVLSGTTC